MSNNQKTSFDHDDYFVNANEFSDVKIAFKHHPERIFYANKAILSEASPIIKAFLALDPDGTFVIDEDENPSMIRPNDVRDLLKFIYPQFTMKINEENINGLIHLSEKYLIETLRNDCKKYVSNWLNDLQVIFPRQILYKDGSRKGVATEIGTLCIWFREYSTRDENLSASILQLLKHASTDELEQNQIFLELVDREKKIVYKTLSEYLEEQQTNENQSKTLASGDA